MNRAPWVVTAVALCVTTTVLLVRSGAAARQANAWHPLADAADVVPGGDNVAPSYHVRLKSLEQRIATLPNDTAALLELAGMLQDGHRPAQAAQRFEAYLAISPANRSAWLDLTASYGAAADWTGAKRAATRMLERFPDDPTALFNLGAIEANLGNAVQARTWFEQAATQQSDSEISDAARSALERLGA